MMVDTHFRRGVRKHVGLTEFAEVDDILESLTVAAPPASGEFTSLVIYPSDDYSLRPGSDVCLWYRATLGEQLQRLRAVVKQLLAKRGVGDSTRFADAAIFAYALTKPAENQKKHLLRILESITSCDLSQFFIIPSSAFFSLWSEANEQPSMSIGHLKLGPFIHTPFAGDVLSTVQYRIAKTGVHGEHRQALAAKEGTICIARNPRSITVLDLDRLNIRANSELEAGLLNYYFDDVAEYWFGEFWREHLDWQLTLAASGGEVLDRQTLYGLPGYTELSIFLDISVNGHNGTISMIEETRHVRDSVAKRFYNFTQGCKEIQDRWQIELDPKETVLYFGAVITLARYITRSREMKLRGFTDEAFVLLITGIEALMADSDDSITKNISRRIAAILSLSDNKQIHAARKDVAKLYAARSRFVHAAIPIDPSLLPALESICERVYFTAIRSQTVTQPTKRDDWRSRWLTLLDYLYATCSVGLTPESGALLETGIRIAPDQPDADKTRLEKYGKMRQVVRFPKLDPPE